jgi:hypothetical protein
LLIKICIGLDYKHEGIPSGKLLYMSLFGKPVVAKSRNVLHFMKTAGSLPYSQEHISGLCP